MTHTPVTGTTICFVGRGPTVTKMENTKACGRRGESMAGARKGGRISRFLKALLCRARNMGLGGMSGMTALITKEIGKKINKRELACSNTRMEGSISVSSEKEKCTGWAIIGSQTVPLTKAIFT